jgi:outer membrane protein
MAKILSKSAIFCVAIISALSFNMASAEGTFKVGYVSLDRLIAESEPAKKARASLDKEFKSREKSLEKNASALRETQQKYEKDFPNLNDEQRTAREAAIGKDIDAFEAERAAFETDLSNAQNKLLQDLLKNANSVIRQIAKNEGYDLVVQEAVYIKPEYDMTQRVIEQLK